MNGYLTPAQSAESEYSEKKSVFLGHLRPVYAEEEAKAFLVEMKKKFADARHNVWAYILPDGTMHSSDDGEPSGTGGAPVLDAIRKRGLTGCAIVVTRYFGGILLGTGGLVRAYSAAASSALDAAGFVQMTVYRRFSLRCSYVYYSPVLRCIEKYGGKTEDVSFAENVDLSFIVKPEKQDALLRELTDLSAGRITAQPEGEVCQKE